MMDNHNLEIKVDDLTDDELIHLTYKYIEDLDNYGDRLEALVGDDYANYLFIQCITEILCAICKRRNIELFRRSENYD